MHLKYVCLNGSLQSLDWNVGMEQWNRKFSINITSHLISHAHCVRFDVCHSPWNMSKLILRHRTLHLFFHLVSAS